VSDWNDGILRDFHDHGGTVERFGRSLIVLHTRGAKSGEPRVNPVMGIPDGDGWIAAATFAGQPVDPAWAHNLRAHPDLEIEVPLPDTGIATVAVQATELPEPERTAAWGRFLAASPGFASYERKTDRRFPIFRFTRAVEL
jgi:deazaflavin-dependent oxidoreductase (nitroreductase family)